ncbi:MAG: hemolysin family protein [Treponema sp.]|jgi:putative hemolysin|nr:hemolysin family protein [Treponema sp.]
MNAVLSEEPPLGALLSGVLFLLAGGGFSLLESAFIASRRSRFRSLAEAGGKNYSRALRLFDNAPSFLLALRFWIGGCFTAAAAALWGLAPSLQNALAALTGSPRSGAILAALSAGGGIALGVFFLGEVAPKQFALAAPEPIIAACIPLIRPLMALSAPLTWTALRCVAALRALLRLDKRAASGMTEDELRIALREGEKSGIVESKERSMVEGVFYLGDRTVETFMIHRSEMAWLDIQAPAGEAKAAAIHSPGQSFFPVVTGTVDKVVGLVSVRDILSSLLEEPWGGLKSIMKPPRFVPKSMSALKAFESFKREEDTDFLCVIDEYGGFAGALTRRNLIDEIIGGLSGFSGNPEGIIPREDGAYLVNGSVNIDDLAKVLAVEDLLGDHPEYHTLAGFILNLAKEVPRTGARFDWQGFRFTILAMDGNRIDRLLIERQF